jgi:hypothetical protein
MSDQAPLFAIGLSGALIGFLIGIMVGASDVASNCREKGQFDISHERYQCQKLQKVFVPPTASRAPARVLPGEQA